MTLANIRTDYQRASLSEEQVDADPIKQFSIWFQEALDAKVAEPNAMSLATVNQQGRPSSRIVLIKELDQRGITWYTHYTSRKGEELATNPHAALLFFWSELERQVRIEGRVEKVTALENDTYFNSRPLASRLGALASEQSQVIANRALLDERVEKITAQYGDQVPRPEHWGGYRLVPDYLEFWQGRSSRLHDRIAYEKNADGVWLRSRLQP
ncbi:pyridoxamine 5'-phosphate oxidase [Solimicrobium silvestre]|uniref:Pyridoxine/pyridoxamine 5'-phosphate oxidase n=1 Tax=Solimicrobium silvestre TaxID=2099400 RepID=A0A2S9H4I7_9BURK|nr:pyridoxamine 5'-phosphate oxidase [Solimicrobium silvestre]PRC94851.1 pdxH: pyridoxamine 5'-phosphate oxidase [Solimicrobium silvestre]